MSEQNVVISQAANIVKSLDSPENILIYLGAPENVIILEVSLRI